MIYQIIRMEGNRPVEVLRICLSKKAMEKALKEMTARNGWELKWAAYDRIY